MGHDDGEILGLAQLILLVRDQSALLFGEAEQLGDGVIKQGFGHMFFVKCKVVLEMRAQCLFDADLPGALGHRDQHDVHQAHAADPQC